MYLDQVAIINYKSCKILDFKLKPNNPNIFIGVNDSGKSTLLKAVQFFFNKPNCSFNTEGHNKSDLSNSSLSQEDFNSCFIQNSLPICEDYNQNSIYVLGKLRFSENEIDEISEIDLSNTLSWAIENQFQESIWILKNINNEAISTKILLSSNNDYAHIFVAPATELNKLKRDLHISQEDINNLNSSGRFSNLELIRAINSKITLDKIWVDYKLAKRDSEIFPTFEYFDWKTSMDEINSIASSLMKDKIEEFIQPIKQTAIEKALLAETAINEEFGRLQEKISSVAPEVELITSKIHFEVKEKVSDIMVQKSQSDGLIHLDNQGDGLKRKIWFSLIKAKADTAIESSLKKYIWAFDEPETHLYPAAQRDFFDILKKLSESNVQTLISTHSTIFIDKAKTNDIYNVFKDDLGYTNLSFCEDIESIYNSLKVKNSDFLFHDKFIIVEGDTEQFLIPKLYEIYTGRTFMEDNIQLINIEGKDKWRMNKGILNSITEGFKKIDNSMILLFDNDMSYQLDSVDKTENVFFVGIQDIEDSIDSNLWVEIINHYYEGILVIDINFINQIKESIPIGTDVPNNKKFFKKLEASLRKKWIEDGNDVDEFITIPTKGEESANFILEKLVNKDLIPEQIKRAFDKLIEL